MGDVAVIDEVRYGDLGPGGEHVLIGILVDTTTAEPVKKVGLLRASVVAFASEGRAALWMSLWGGQVVGRAWKMGLDGGFR